MAASILSEDILAICLFLADGNIDLPLEKIIRHAENYQEKQNRHFGITRRDFRNLFRQLFTWKLNINYNEILNVKLYSIINNILKYDYTHFNDEGEHWVRYDQKYEESDSSVIKYWYGYDDEEYLEKKRMKENMVRIFKDCKIASLNSESIKKFMKELGITDSVLFHNSRIGELS